MYFIHFPDVFQYSPLMENFFYLLFMLLFICQRGNNHFDVHFRWIGPVLFPSKDVKDAVREGRNGRKCVYFPQKSAFLPFLNTMNKELFPIFSLNWPFNKYVSRQGKGINRRTESNYIGR